MMKQLVIAEKPSVARDLAKALGSFRQNKQGYYENERYIIASALGHVVELFMPEDIDAKYKHWSLKNLPILPEKFQLKPIKASQKRFEDLKKLMARKEVEGLINACDAGREGELIFAHLCELVECEKPKQRLWLSSMTTESIREAFASLRPNESMIPLQEAARCRAESDWLVGINGTRAVTGRMLGSKRREVASVGRVQTPTLSLVYEREQAINAFQPVPFWKVKGLFSVQKGAYEGWLQRENFVKSEQNPDDRQDRFWSEKEGNDLFNRLQLLQGKKAAVSETTKSSKQSSPKLFDLTSLQRECNQRFGLSAKHTLDVAQSLYEKHKALTYPRTDSRALPEDYVSTCQAVLGKLSGPYNGFASKILENGWINPAQKSVFNNKAVSDHFAIIPTEKTPDELRDDEQKVYDLVVRRFLSVFFPAAEFAVTIRLTSLDSLTFRTEGKVLVSPGWLEVVKKTDAKEALPALTQGDEGLATVLGFERMEETTHPPARFTEATLLASMERAGQFVEDEELAEAMKEKGLGTPATRAQIIEHLLASKYLERNGKELVPTAKAEQLFEFLRAVHVQELASPALTGEWEYRLRLIQNGQLSRTQFMTDIRQMTSKIVESILAFKDSDQEGRSTQIIAPSDGLPMLETFRGFRSQDGKVSIFKVIGNRRMTEKEIAELVQKRRLGPLSGFKSKTGKPFSAILELTDEYRIKFNFEGSGDEISSIENLEEYPIVGDCPICKKGAIYATEVSFLCGNSQDAKINCKFRITRVLLNRSIPDEQFEKLLKNGKTDLIERFRSKRTGKYFSAYLVLNEEGAIGFEFMKKTETKKETTAVES